MKRVFAVTPFQYKDAFNFKMSPYEAWIKLGGQITKEHYPWRILHKLAFKYDLPSLKKGKRVVELRFVQSVSLCFDTFPGYIYREIIPFVWDCWPMFFEKTCHWLKKHQVKTAIFTSSQTAERMRKIFPEMNILTITEGIDMDRFEAGVELSERQIIILEMIYLDSSISAKAMSEKISEKDSVDERTIQRDLSKLKKIGILIRKGGRKNGEWVIVINRS